MDKTLADIWTRYRQTLIGVAQAAFVSATWVLNSVLHPHHQLTDWTFWAWIVAFWVFLPGLGFMSDRARLR